MLNHGGDLQTAAKLAANYQGHWLDLSTGISPWVWPVTTPPASVWQRLPEISSSFKNAVSSYYGHAEFIPLPGSQYAIERIPQLLPTSIVALPRWGYGEHAKAWLQAGHELLYYESFDELLRLCPRINHAVVINPNNPTGDYWAESQLRNIESKLPGYMLVDMAFADVYVGEKTPTVANNRIILRSFGKFFGMAGLRLGFVYLPEKLRAAFVSHLPLWAVSSLSLWVAEAALTDVTWHQRQRQRITAARDALFYYAKQRFMGCEIVRGPMFVSVYGNYEYLKQCQQRFAECGVWLRLFYLPEAMPNTYLRLGLPADIKRLEQVTKSLEL